MAYTRSLVATVKEMNRKPDFVAKLFYLTSAQGGRDSFALSGYRPHIQFSYKKYNTSGRQKFINKEVVKPGESVEAEITIIAIEEFKNELYPGMLFKFCEGSRVTGFGGIVEIINKDLEKNRQPPTSASSNRAEKQAGSFVAPNTKIDN